MHNPDRGEVAVELGGVMYVMRPTFQALREIEVGTGQKLVPLVEAFARRNFGATDVAVVVTAGIRGGGEKAATFEKVGDMLAEKGIANPEVVSAVILFLTGALNGGTKPGEAKAAGATK